MRGHLSPRCFLAGGGVASQIKYRGTVQLVNVGANLLVAAGIYFHGGNHLKIA